MLLRETRVRSVFMLLVPLLLRVDVPTEDEDERRLPPLVTPNELLLDELLRLLLNDEAVPEDLEELEERKEDDLVLEERPLRAL